MSESSRKTHSPLTCLVFAMLVAYACSSSTTTVTSPPTTTQATTTATPASVSSSTSASSSPASSTPSNSSETSASTSPGSSPTTSGNTTGTPPTSPTPAPATVTTGLSSSSLSPTVTTAAPNISSSVTTTGQSAVNDSSVSTGTAAPQSSQSPGSTSTPETTTPANKNGTTAAPTTAAPATGTPITAAPTTEAPTTAAPTSPEPTTTAPTTPAPTTPAPTTAPPPPNSKPIKPDATFLLIIDVGPGKNVSCNGCNYSSVKNYFQTEFEKVPGYFSIASVESTTFFNVNIRFSGTEIQTLNETQVQQKIWEALVGLNNTAAAGLVVMDSAKNIASAFAEKSTSLCKMDGTCDLEYDCKDRYCLHKCEEKSCGDHGTCSVTIDSSGKASAACACNSDDETKYSGENCEKSEISQKKVAAIVGGVLGAFCGLFIIIIIVMCCRQRSNSSSSSKYQLGGNTNQGYSTMGMKEL